MTRLSARGRTLAVGPTYAVNWRSDVGIAQTKSGKKARAPLTRERVLRAAVDLADERGIEALTMRNLGQQLGVEAMSLYNHVANKDDIVDGLVEIGRAHV